MPNPIVPIRHKSRLDPLRFPQRGNLWPSPCIENLPTTSFPCVHNWRGWDRARTSLMVSSFTLSIRLFHYSDSSFSRYEIVNMHFFHVFLHSTLNFCALVRYNSAKASKKEALNIILHMLCPIHALPGNDFYWAFEDPYSII